MARAKSFFASSALSTANLGFEAKPWLAANKLRNNMDAAVSSKATSVPQAKAYKHVALGLSFSKYISDAFEKKMPRLVPELHAQFAESARLEEAIRTNLKGLGYK